VQRLLLGSYGIAGITQVLDGDPHGLPLVYVPTAAGPQAETKFWVQADRRQLQLLGCDTATLDLALADDDEIEACLRGAAAVFVTGGDAYRLLWHARRSGFSVVVRELVERGDLFYVGTSAGAILAGPDVAPLASWEDATDVPQLPSTEALGLVEFTILPHDDHDDHSALNETIVLTNPQREFIKLRDDQAVVVRGDETTIVDSPLIV
jgi:dipeptidase E